MSYTLDIFDEGHILVITMGSEYRGSDDIVQLSLDVVAKLETAPDRVVLISDAREDVIRGLGEIIERANNIRRPEVSAVYKHPKVIKTVIVLNNRVLQVATRGLNSASFGHLEVPIFETLEDALDYSRNVLYGAEKAG